MTWLMTRGAMLVIVALAIGSYSRVQAQDYPARPITIAAAPEPSVMSTVSSPR